MHWQKSKMPDFMQKLPFGSDISKKTRKQDERLLKRNGGIRAGH